MHSEPLTRGLTEQEIHDVLSLHSTFAANSQDASEKIAEAYRLIQTLDPELILQEHSGNTINLRQFLTHFLQEAPNTKYVARALVDEYPTPLRDQDVVTRVKFISSLWLNSFLYPLKGVRHSNPTPTTLDTPLTPSAVATDDLEHARRIQKDIANEVCPREFAQNVFSSQVLPRDGYRDVVHGELSLDAPIAMDVGDESPKTTNTAHILPFALNKWPSPDGAPFEKQILWDVLVNWVGHDLSFVKGEGINRPRNAFTLQPEEHGRFGAFKLWFEAIDQEPNRYYLRTVRKHPRQNQIIEFSSANGVDLPDPGLLKIHAAAARVLHFSGAANVFDSMDRQEGPTHTLQVDGSSDITCLVNSLWATGRALPVGA